MTAVITSLSRHHRSHRGHLGQRPPQSPPPLALEAVINTHHPAAAAAAADRPPSLTGATKDQCLCVNNAVMAFICYTLSVEHNPSQR